MYSMQYGKAFLARRYLEPECFFSTTKHRIETGRYADGRSYFKEPDFMIMGGTFSNDFFYLNRKVIGQRHLFTSDFGATGRFVTYFSQQLMDKFAAFGDIFSKNCDCVRIGVAD